MWKQRYNKIFKTSKPNLVITSVCAFPNLQDTLEKAVEYYGVKQLQKDQTLLEIKADFHCNHGCDFIPLYFQDDIPKLAKLEKINPRGKGFFWCIAYQSPNLIRHSEFSSTYNMPSHKQYKVWLEYWINKHYKGQHDSIANFLFRQCVKAYVYEQSNNFSEELKDRRFDVIANCNLRFKPTENAKDMLDFIDKMYITNWYEFVFKEFKK